MAAMQEPVALPSAFEALKYQPFDSCGEDTTAHVQATRLSAGLSTPSPCPSPPVGLQSPDGSMWNPRASLGLTRRASSAALAAAASARLQLGRPNLSRQSTLSEMVEQTLGHTSFGDLCGSSYVAPDRLKRLKTLGEGAFAEVEKAEMAPEESAGTSGGTGTGGSRVVAVKKLKQHLMESQRDCMSFIGEAQLLINMPPHPAIIGYIGLGCADSSSLDDQWRTLYLVQEFAAGGTIKSLVFQQMVSVRKKLYTQQDALRWGAQIAEGLAHMHGYEPMILHRDLKAENVLLSPNDQGGFDARIADFGLHALLPKPGRPEGCSSAISEEGEEQAPAPAAGQDGTDKYRMTGQTGAFVYMAPEVLLGKPYNEKVDVFSFGIILYEMLHRKMLVADLMHLGDPEAARSHAYSVAAGYRLPINRGLPVELQDLIASCWADKPEDRPSMVDAAKVLREALSKPSLAPAPSSRRGAAPAADAAPAAGCCTVM